MRFTDIYEIAEEKAYRLNVFDTFASDIFQVVVVLRGNSATYYTTKDAEEVVFDYTPLTDGLIYNGSSEIEVGALYSPGHTIGSTSFAIDQKFLLTGDILFIVHRST